MSNKSANGKDQAATGKQFQVQKIYLKDVSVEAPNSPHVFQEEWQPEVSVQLGNSATALADSVHEVVTSITVTAKLGEKTAFLVEVHQAGIFTLAGFSAEERGAMLGSYCPTVLFPYAREAVSDLVAKAGFPQLLLQPVDFNAIYAQHQQQVRNKAAGAGSAASGGTQ